MHNRKTIYILFLVAAIIIVSTLYVITYSRRYNNLQIDYDHCMDFSRFYSPNEVESFLPSNIVLPPKIGNNSLMGITFWKRTGINTLFVYYVIGNVSSLGCMDYFRLKFTPFYILKGRDLRGVSIMIVIHLYKSSSEVDKIFNNESAKLLKYGYKVTSIKGYTVVYRDGLFKDFGKYIEIDSPTYVAIKLDKAIVIIYSIYNYNILKNYIQELIT